MFKHAPLSFFFFFTVLDLALPDAISSGKLKIEREAMA